MTGPRTPRSLARMALIAVVALLFVVVGTNGRFAAHAAFHVAAAPYGPPVAPAPVETSGDAPHLLDAPGVRLGDRQARLRGASPRRADATPGAPRADHAPMHVAALHGAAAAVAIAARARERDGARLRPADHPAAPPDARAPPFRS